jgi:hypothetical protein
VSEIHWEIPLDFSFIQYYCYVIVDAGSSTLSVLYFSFASIQYLPDICIPSSMFLPPASNIAATMASLGEPDPGLLTGRLFPGLGQDRVVGFQLPKSTMYISSFLPNQSCLLRGVSSASIR